MRRVVVLVVGLLVLQAMPAQAAPDVVRQKDVQRRCWIAAGTHGHRGSAQGAVEVHQSPPGHSWRIHFRYRQHNFLPVWGHVFFEGTRVASDSGDLVAQVARPDWGPGVRPVPDDPVGVEGRAVDRQTGEVCKVFARYQ